MDFVPWKAPSDKDFALHKLGRALARLTKTHTATLNRLHAAAATKLTPTMIIDSLKRELKFIETEQELLRKSCIKIIRTDAELTRKFTLLISIPGIADKSACAILGELVVLPDDLSQKAWVKYAGLDPSNKSSGTSVKSKTRIAKRGNVRLRGALFMPAMRARTVSRFSAPLPPSSRSTGATNSWKVKIAEVGKPGRITTGLRPAAARQIGFPGFSATPCTTAPAASSAVRLWRRNAAISVILIGTMNGEITLRQTK